MLAELSVVEQRYLAVREVLEAKISDVATRYGVDRRTIHRWVVRYANEGLGALADRMSRARLLAIAVLELEVDDATDPCIANREAELLERAEHSLALGVEDAGLRPDEHGRSHARTTSGSAR